MIRRLFIFIFVCLFFLTPVVCFFYLDYVVNNNTIEKGEYSYVEGVGIKCGKLHIIQNSTNYLFGFGEYVVINESYIDIEKMIEEYEMDVIEVEYLEDLNLKTYLLYCPKLPKFRISNNRKFNLQICQSKFLVKIGYPAIFDSF